MGYTLQQLQQMGATPGVVPQKKKYTYDELKKLGATPTQPTQTVPERIPGILGPAKEAYLGLKTLYGGGEHGIANKLKQDIQAGSEDIKKGLNEKKATFGGGLSVLKGVAKSGLRTAGDVAGAIYAPVGAAIQSVGVNRVFDDIGQKVRNGEGLVGQAVDKITNLPSVQKFATKHPNAGEDFGRALTLAMASGENGKIDPKTIVKRTVEQFTSGNTKAMNTIDRHYQEATDVKTNLPPENMNILGGEKGLIERTKINIVDGLRAEGLTKQSDLVSKIDTSTVPTLDAFKIAAQDIIKQTHSKIRAIDDLENTYRTLTGGTKSGMKKQTKIDAKVNAMNNAGTTGRAPERVLAEKGIIPEAKGTKLNTFQQAEDLRSTVSPLRDANRKALAETELGTSMNKLDDLEAKAIEYSRTPQNINSGRAKKMAEEIKKEFDILRAEYPTGEIPLTVVDDIKSARWDNVFKNKGLVDADVLRKDSEYSIAKALQKHIEEVSEKAGNKQVAQLNREIGDIMDAAKYLDDMNGNTLKGGRLLKYITTAIGSSLGQSIPGKIIGAFGGNFIGDMLIANNISNPIKRFILRTVRDKDPKAYIDTIEWLAKQKDARANRLLLPAGDKKAIELFDGIQRTPSGVIKETPVSVLPAEKNLTTVNPKTGRFQTTYNSQSKSPTSAQTMNAISNDAIIPIKSTLPKAKPNVKQTTSSDATLIQEAKKYKSAEEFMNTQQSYFRGQPEGDSLMTRGGGDGGYGKGLMFTDSPTTARVWHNNVLEFGFKPGSNVRTFKGDYDFKNEVYDWALKTKGDQYRYNVDTNTIINDWATANGIDAVSTPFGGTIFNNSSVITKQQMKKIWAEANK